MNARASAGLLFAVGAAGLFLGAVHVRAPAAALLQMTCSSALSIRDCFDKYFNDVAEFDDDDRKNLFAALDAADWSKGLAGTNAASCRKVFNAVNAAYYGGSDALYTGILDPAAVAVDVIGAHHPKHAILFHSEMLIFSKDALETALHEAAHHVGIDHGDAFSSYDAENCAEIQNEEDDDPDPGGNTGTTETCTETEEWVPPETDEEFVKPEPSTTEGGGTLPGPPGVTPTPLPPVVVGFDSGKWVDVVISEGYWETVKECTLN